MLFVEILVIFLIFSGILVIFGADWRPVLGFWIRLIIIISGLLLIGIIVGAGTHIFNLMI